MRITPLTALAFALAGCVTATPQGARQAGPSTAPVTDRPLERLAAQPILVFPTQYLSFGDELGWRKEVARPSEYLAGLDDEIAFAMNERGLGRKWTFASEITRIARKNSTVVSDPHGLSADALRGKVKLDESLGETLRSQIRSILALSDARFVLLPVEVRFESANGTGVASLRVVLIDARFAMVKWVGDVSGERSRTFSPALAAGVASRFADLVAPIPSTTH